MKFKLFDRFRFSLGGVTGTAVPRLLQEPRASGHVASFDGTQIYWELHGPKPTTKTKRPLVFCYGLVCSMNQWRYQLERYSHSHPCLILDYRGHHRSDFPADVRLMNISAIAKDVAAAMKFHHFKAAHIWGHSMGVNVALELAVAEPALCHSLVLCCGTLHNPFRSMFGTDVLEKVTDPLLKSYPEHEQVFYALGKLFLGHAKLTRIVAQIAGFNDEASTPADMDAYALAVASINPKTFFPLLIEMSKGFTAGIAPKVKIPAIVVAGGKDHVTPPPSQKLLAEALPRATYCEIPLGSHNVQLDFGEYVSLKVEEFWKARSLS